MIPLNLPLPGGRAILQRTSNSNTNHALIGTAPAARSLQGMFNFARPFRGIGARESENQIAVTIAEPPSSDKTSAGMSFLIAYARHTRNACVLCVMLTLMLLGTAIGIAVSFGNRTAASASPVVQQAQHILQDVSTVSTTISARDGVASSLQNINEILKQVRAASNTLSPIMNLTAGTIAHADDATKMLQSLMNSSSTVLKQAERIAKHPTLTISLSD